VVKSLMKRNLETVTPDIAEQWLRTRSANQRNINGNHVRFFARLMVSGEFYGEAPTSDVVFDQEEFLINGQHRLAAVVMSGVTVRMWVARNVPSCHFSLIDTGSRARTSYDMARIDGVNLPAKSIQLVDSILCLSSAIELGNELRTVVAGRKIPHHLRMEFIAWADAERLEACGKWAKSNDRIYRTENCAVKAAVWFAQDLGYPVNQWRERLVMGNGLSMSDPFRWLRNQYLFKGGPAADHVFPYVWTAFVKAKEGKSSRALAGLNFEALVQETLSGSETVKTWGPRCAAFFTTTSGREAVARG
jgi:hypothetical protein